MDHRTEGPATGRWGAGAVALLLVASAAGCGESDGGATASAATEDFCERTSAAVAAFMDEARERHPVPDDPDYGGSVVIGTIGEMPDGMNAFVSGDHTAAQHQTYLNLMTLIRYDEDIEPVPYLAESWELDDEETPTTVTFHLRRDVYWHDGERTDAYDVAFTWERMTDRATGFPNLAFWDSWVHGPEGVEVVDSFTVRLRLARPHAELLDPWTSARIMPEHLLGDVPAAELGQHPFGTVCPVGNGPFVFVEHRPLESWTFEANPAFAEGLGGRPRLDRYVYRVIPEETTLLTGLLTGEIDVYIMPRPEQLAEIEAAPHLEVLSFPFREYVFVAWNARRPELADARVRRAITLATNRSEIVEALLGDYGRVANTGVPPFHWAHDPTLADSLPYAPDRARRLLDEAGWIDRDGDGIRENAAGDPLRFTIKYNQGNQRRQSIAEIMQAQLRLVGMDVQPEVVEYTTLISQITSPETRDFDGVVMGWATDFRVDDSGLFHSSRSEEPFAMAGASSPGLDRLLDTLQVVLDRKDGLPLWHEYQRTVLAEMPFTYFYFPDRMAGVNRRVRGVEMDVRGEWISVADWWIPREQRRDGRRPRAD